MISAWAANIVLLDYTGGFDPIPAEIKAGTLQWLSMRSIAKGRDPMIRSETIPDVISVFYQQSDSGSSSSYSSDPRLRSANGCSRIGMWFL